MREGILRTAKDPNLRPETQRPELSPHYEATKRQNTARISFCASCSEMSCSCNKQIVQLWATMIEIISRLRLVEGGPIKLSMHHFFTCEEMEYFLKTFTQERMLYIHKCFSPNVATFRNKSVSSLFYNIQ